MKAPAQNSGLVGFRWEQKLREGTYLWLSGELLNSHVREAAGAFDLLYPETEYASSSGLNEILDYNEKTFQFAADQLLGKEWSMGATIRNQPGGVE